MSDKPAKLLPLSDSNLLEWDAWSKNGRKFSGEEVQRLLITLRRDRAQLRELQEHARALRDLVKEPA